jgi:hypothetical protein
MTVQAQKALPICAPVGTPSFLQLHTYMHIYIHSMDPEVCHKDEDVEQVINIQIYAIFTA